MHQQFIDYAEEIVDIFRALHKEFRTQIIKESCRYGLTVPQMLLIHELQEHPGVTLNDLSKKLSLSKSTVSGIVDRLEKGEYVTREIPKDNRRIVKISLLPKGIEISAIVKDVKSKQLSKLLEKVDISETEEIIHAFRKFHKLIIDSSDKE
jgi:DNA-binding MarR family transcriptional regulator